MQLEQQRPPRGGPDDGIMAPAASAVSEALQRARNGEAGNRPKLGGALNALLRRPVAQLERGAMAQLLLEKLDDGAFHDLYDGDGVSCRATAVEAVLALGYPYALNVMPDDLEYLRSMKPVTTRAATLRIMAVVTGLLAALFALGFLIHL
jgi:hypothetical protein